MNDQSQALKQPHMMNRNFGAAWTPLVPLPPDDPMNFVGNYQRQGGFMGQPGAMGPKGGGGRGNWKGKKGKKGVIGGGSSGAPGAGGGPSGGGGGGGYRPPTLHELQSQNRVKAKRFYPKKKFNNRFAPYAPRNTSSFLIRAKKSGGIAPFVSPCPVTPAVLPTPVFSPSKEVLGDMAKEEWGVDGYGSMNGLIRLRSPGNEINEVREYDEEDGGGSSESDVEEHVEVERRLDHDLSRFEMICPNFAEENANLFENQMDDRESHIAQLEEENLTLKERLFLMERELVELRMRVQVLEADNRAKKDNNDGILENETITITDKQENDAEIMIETENATEKEENIDDEEGSENEGGGDVCSEKSFGDCP